MLFFLLRYNLRILGLMSMDSGIFQCLASNPAGNIQAAARLTVVSSGMIQCVYKMDSVKLIFWLLFVL